MVHYKIWPCSGCETSWNRCIIGQFVASSADNVKRKKKRTEKSEATSISLSLWAYIKERRRHFYIFGPPKTYTERASYDGLLRPFSTRLIMYGFGIEFFFLLPSLLVPLLAFVFLPQS